MIAARGSSDNAARYAQHVLGRLCGMPVALATPSLHTLYDAPPRYDGALVIGISQSGASPDVVASCRGARRQGCADAWRSRTTRPRRWRAPRRTCSRCTPARSARSPRPRPTPPRSAAVAALAARSRRRARGARAAGDARGAGAPARAHRRGRRRGGAAARWERLAVIGRGANYATAFEAALKIKELAGIAAEPYSPADFLHGPIAIVGPGFPVLGIAPPGPTEAGDARAARRPCASAARDVAAIGNDPAPASRSCGSSPSRTG